jgi:uncharacterized membrane protein
MKSNTLRVRALRRAFSLHPMACVVFAAAVALVILAVNFWPGGAPPAVPFVGTAAAAAIGILVQMMVSKRRRYIRTARDVERMLKLRVVATYAPSVREDW